MKYYLSSFRLGDRPERLVRLLGKNRKIAVLRVFGKTQRLVIFLKSAASNFL